MRWANKSEGEFAAQLKQIENTYKIVSLNKRTAKLVLSATTRREKLGYLRADIFGPHIYAIYRNP